MKWPKMISTKDLAYITDMFSWNETLRTKLNYFMCVNLLEKGELPYKDFIK